MILGAIAILFLTGLALAPRGEWDLRMGEGFLLAAGLAAALLGAFSLAGVMWSRAIFVTALIAFSACCLILRRRATSDATVRKSENVSPRPAGGGARVAEGRVRGRADRAAWLPGAARWEGILVLLLDAAILLTIAGYALRAYLTPMVQQDFVAIWGLKGKIFFAYGGVDTGWLRAHPTSQPDYPILLPLVLDAVALLSGSWSDAGLGLVWAAFGAAAVLVLRGHLRRESMDALPARLAALAMTAPLLSLWIGLAEGLLMAYAVAGLLRIRRAALEGDAGSMRLGALFLGLAAATKNEGLTLLFLTMVAVAFWQPARALASHTWPALAALPWIVVRSAAGLHSYFSGGGAAHRLLLRLADPAPILRALARDLPPKPFFIATALAILLLTWRRLRAPERMIVLIALAQAALFITAYFVTPFDPATQIEYSWGRILEPIAAFLGIAAMFGLVRNRRTLEGEEMTEE
jgi:hypothetical protein